ncbi:hypothetical protein HYPSUDRAFT_46438 [Hypholoma sublateritium FD-334 SS-4]|uniref:Uncharacterized protein n=1 Tax=Hypholoma sublateritium (strain FD-334 SS-4) TaxID=945553 RepID=A0A0D2NLF1_HYPSF|nr:hypothetical protein HYPSUDRAFT_46438 [Hypholoma sublateritium FD-334 SS-4]
MANSQRSYLSNFIDLFTLMLNTPLVEPESAHKPVALPLKTFVSSQKPSVEYSEQPGTPKSYSINRSSLDTNQSSVGTISTQEAVRDPMN